jgi:hypothetical protein
VDANVKQVQDQVRILSLVSRNNSLVIDEYSAWYAYRYFYIPGRHVSIWYWSTALVPGTYTTRSDQKYQVPGTRYQDCTMFLYMISILEYKYSVPGTRYRCNRCNWYHVLGT